MAKSSSKASSNSPKVYNLAAFVEAVKSIPEDNIPGMIAIPTPDLDLKKYLESHSLTTLIDSLTSLTKELAKELTIFYDSEPSSDFYHWCKRLMQLDGEKINGKTEFQAFKKFIEPSYMDQVRIAAINVFHSRFPKEETRINYIFLSLANNQNESIFIRHWALKQLKPQALEITDIEEMLAIAKKCNELDSKGIISATLEVLGKIEKIDENLKNEIDQQVESLLLYLLYNNGQYNLSEQLQYNVINTLGKFASIDVMEEIMIWAKSKSHNLSSNSSFAKTDPPKTLSSALDILLHRLISKPINLLAIRPENFENLIGQLLIKLNYHDVKVTQHYRDEGIDITAKTFKDHLGKYQPKDVVIQCKRYSKNQVSKHEAEEFLVAMDRKKAAYGYFIITSKFSPSAQEIFQDKPNITTCDGDQLLELLQEHFGPNLYYIGLPPQTRKS